MSIYQTEEEQVESIKKWWKENGMSIVLGVAIGLGGIVGWKAWTSYQDSIGQQASAAFEQLIAAAGSGNPDSALKQAELMEEEFGKASPYTAFAALVTAKIQYEEGDKMAARTNLEHVIKEAPDTALRQIAVLRLTRILIEDGDLSAASGLLRNHPPGSSFAGDYAALQGDIALAEGDDRAARTAYEEALSKNTSNAALIQLKLDNLRPAS